MDDDEKLLAEIRAHTARAQKSYAAIPDKGGQPLMYWSGVYAADLLESANTLLRVVERMRADLSKWRQSFDGHVYVKNEDYAAMRADNERMREAHRENVAEVYKDRETVTPEIAWEAFKRSNATVCRMADRSRAALGDGGGT